MINNRVKVGRKGPGLKGLCTESGGRIGQVEGILIVLTQMQPECRPFMHQKKIRSVCMCV